MKEYSVDEKLKIANWVTNGATALIGAAVTLAIGIILVKLLWDWTIPELFPTAVEQGLILGEITWLAALKITGLAAILTGTGSLIVGRRYR